MEFKIHRDVLKDALSAIQKVAQAAKDMPLLSMAGNVMIEANASEIIMSATDLSIGVRMYLGAKVSKQGAICLPVDVLMDVVNALPAKEVIQFKVKSKTRIATLECVGNRTNIKGAGAEEFPALPSFDTYPINVPSADMQQLIACTVFSAQKDDTRPVLTAVFFQLTEAGLTMVSADGFRLSVVKSDVINGSLETLIPARALATLSKGIATILAQEEEETDIPIQMAIDPTSGKIGFRVAGLYELVVSPIMGTFPDYNSILPRNYETYLTVETEAFERALKLHKPFAKDAAWATKIRATDGRVNISSVSQEKGDADSLIDAHVEGNPIEISFNYEYLMDALKVIQTDKVMIKFVSPSSPAMIVPFERDDFLHVIMPMSGPDTKPRNQEKQGDLKEQPEESETVAEV